VGESYAAAGVDIAAGEEAVERIKAHVRTTYRPEVLGDVGGFGAMFAFDPTRYTSPVLVSSTDSVGTKALVALQAGRFDTIGLDLVAMVVDDIAAQGAEPLFFLDTILVGHLEPERIERLVGGIAAGCRQAGCALVGGEMAELPGLLDGGKFDLVGFGVGVVDRSRLVDGRRVEPGDRLVGLLSPGLRSNGYSLARRVLLEQAALPLDGPAWPGAGHTLGDELLRPSVIYSPALRRLQQAVDVRALAHVTGGGIPGNVARGLPPHCDAVVHVDAWTTPPIFTEIRDRGGIDAAEMSKVFNLGIGMVAVVPAPQAAEALSVLHAAGARAVEIGEVVAGTGTVHLD
jgi:phosphoribosylformylglycinamidine cyclo-ligase